MTILFLVRLKGGVEAGPFFVLHAERKTIGISEPFGGRLRLNRLACKFVRKATIQSNLCRYQYYHEPPSRHRNPI